MFTRIWKAVNVFMKPRAAEANARGQEAMQRGDLDEAVQGVIYSAFGYAGQKCSACSRVVVLNSVHDEFVRRLVDATKSLKIGAAEEADALGAFGVEDKAVGLVTGHAREVVDLFVALGTVPCLLVAGHGVPVGGTGGGDADVLELGQGESGGSGGHKELHRRTGSLTRSPGPSSPGFIAA